MRAHKDLVMNLLTPQVGAPEAAWLWDAAREPTPPGGAKRPTLRALMRSALRARLSEHNFDGSALAVAEEVVGLLVGLELLTDVKTVYAPEIRLALKDLREANASP